MTTDTAEAVSAVEENTSDLVDAEPVGNPAGNIATLRMLLNSCEGKFEATVTPVRTPVLNRAMRPREQRAVGV